MNKSEIKDFFNSHAESWDENMICDGEKINTILDFAGVESGKYVLDIACGTGVLFDFYLSRGVKEITGVDISENMVKAAKEKYADNGRIKVICADAEFCDFEKTYDCCMVFNAFPHFPNPDRLIANLATAVKCGGTLTVAHDRGRKALDLHHSGEASKISLGLISEKELAKKLSDNGFIKIQTVSTDEIYIVSGIKK